jgi:hypothetical protein
MRPTLHALRAAALLGLALASPTAWADAAPEDTSDTHQHDDEATDSGDDDSKGCAHLATPVTGLSLLLGAALAFGLRRRA